MIKETMFKIKPKLSIGMPVYNGESYIKESIKSLLDQTFRDFELIISDNCSSDNTSKICQEYCQKDSRIKYIRQLSNIGAEANFEYVLQQSIGDYFMWAAHDDMWEDNWLEVLSASIQPDDIGVRGGIAIINSKGNLVTEREFKSFPRNGYIKIFLDDERNSKNFYIYSLFNISKLRSVSFKSLYLDYYPDFIFPLALISQGNLRRVNGTKQFYRMHDANLGLVYNAKWLDWHRLLYRAHPLRYYLNVINEVPKLYKLLIFLTIPIKHMKSQFTIWYRGAFFVLTGHKKQ